MGSTVRQTGQNLGFEPPDSLYKVSSRTGSKLYLCAFGAKRQRIHFCEGGEHGFEQAQELLVESCEKHARLLGLPVFPLFVVVVCGQKLNLLGHLGVPVDEVCGCCMGLSPRRKPLRLSGD